MQSAEGPRRGISRILSQCTDHELFKQQTRYFLQKSHQMKQYQSRLDSSIRQLKTLENDESEEEHPTSNAEMAETFYAQQSQPKIIPFRMLIDSPDKYNKIKLRSLPSQHLKTHQGPSYRSPRSPNGHMNTKSQPRVNLPNLLSKMKKGKLPTNASKNKQIEYECLRESQDKEVDLTYEKIKIERRKMEETRHLIVLGKVLDENYRKDLRKLHALKRHIKMLRNY